MLPLHGEFLTDAVRQKIADPRQRTIKPGDRLVDSSSQIVDRVRASISQFNQSPVLFFELPHTIGQGLTAAIGRLLMLLILFSNRFQHFVTEVTLPGSMSLTVLQNFEHCESTGPVKKGLVAVVLIEFPHQGDRGVLQNVIHIGGNGNHRQNVSPQPSFMTGIQPDEFLVFPRKFHAVDLDADLLSRPGATTVVYIRSHLSMTQFSPKNRRTFKKSPVFSVTTTAARSVTVSRIETYTKTTAYLPYFVHHGVEGIIPD
ncbi:hypothetical protein L1A08_20890 [Rubinisphaera sp. ICM_H10]|nr:hypothetical protein [Rubinisphaera margarita]MCG6158269.1 hypothetical protein [Rubinisphaera margarita]